MKQPDQPGSRLEILIERARERDLDRVLVSQSVSLRSLTGIVCDHGILEVDLRARRGAPALAFYTDFRYVPMVHRVAPHLAVRDIRRLPARGRRIGYEATIPQLRFLAWRKANPSAGFEDVSDVLAALRAVKSPAEIDGIRAAEARTCEI
jgi:Xaa-Pro aminopeptidase